MMKEKIVDLKNILLENIRKTESLFAENKKEFELFFDNQTELFNNHFPFIMDPYYYLENTEQIKLQAFYKSHYLIFTAYQLLLTGNYGASNMMIRGIFEYLMIGKHFSINPNTSLASKWLKGNQFDIYDSVIKRFQKNKKDSFHKFWCLCCNDNHAMPHSFQIGFDIENREIQLEETFARLCIMQILSYHLLGTHILNSRLKYRSELWGKHKYRNTKLKLMIRENITILKQNINNEGELLIKNYKSDWRLK